MTIARALKHTIRARAAKTGERYTTARRHVLKDLEVRKTSGAPVSLTVPPPADASTATQKTRGGLSDASALERTGHDLAYWFAALDGFGAVEKGHTAAARHLRDVHRVSGWYAQGITVAYERARGVRVPHQRCDGAFEVSVSKTVAAGVPAIAAVLTDRGRRRSLKNVDASLLTALAAAFDRATSKGIIVRPDGQGRFRYKWDDTTVQMNFLPKSGGKTSVVVTHMKLRDAAMVETRRTMWRGALDAVAATFK